MSDALSKLQAWYAAQCEEEEAHKLPWQHKYGISINTSDNPAWNVIIDLAETSLDGITMTPLSVDNSENDWFLCNITDNRFNGVGDPFKLAVILKTFLDLNAD